MKKTVIILLVGILLVLLCGCEKEQKTNGCQEVSGSIQEGNLTATSCASAPNAELACVLALEKLENFQTDNQLSDNYQTQVDLIVKSDITCKITAKW